MVGYRTTCRWLAFAFSTILALLMTGVPIYSSDREHEQYLALRDKRNLLLDKEFYLKKDKEGVNRDIVDLTAKLNSKYHKLQSICEQLKEIDLSIKDIERDMLQ